MHKPIILDCKVTSVRLSSQLSLSLAYKHTHTALLFPSAMSKINDKITDLFWEGVIIGKHSLVLVNSEYGGL